MCMIFTRRSACNSQTGRDMWVRRDIRDERHHERGGGEMRSLTLYGTHLSLFDYDRRPLALHVSTYRVTYREACRVTLIRILLVNCLELFLRLYGK